MAANNTNGTDTMLNAFYAPFTANIAETDDISSWWPEQESTSAVHYHQMANDPVNDQRVPSGTTSPDYPNNDAALLNHSAVLSIHHRYAKRICNHRRLEPFRLQLPVRRPSMAGM